MYLETTRAAASLMMVLCGCFSGVLFLGFSGIDLEIT